MSQQLPSCDSLLLPAVHARRPECGMTSLSRTLVQCGLLLWSCFCTRTVHRQSRAQVPRDQLHLSATLDGFTWSCMAALGSALGGFAVSQLGGRLFLLLLASPSCFNNLLTRLQDRSGSGVLSQDPTRLLPRCRVGINQWPVQQRLPLPQRGQRKSNQSLTLCRYVGCMWSKTISICLCRHKVVFPDRCGHIRDGGGLRAAGLDGRGTSR